MYTIIIRWKHHVQLANLKKKMLSYRNHHEVNLLHLNIEGHS